VLRSLDNHRESQAAEITHLNFRLGSKATLAEISFSGGEKVLLEPNDIVVFVGPNNSGKSKTLTEIAESLSIDETNLDERFRSQLVVKSMKLAKNGTSEDLWEFLVRNGSARGDSVRFQNHETTKSRVKAFDQRMLGNVAPYFCLKLDAQSRLGVVQTQNGVGPGGIAAHPQHFLYDNEQLMSQLSREFRSAFDLDLFFDFRGAPQIPIHVGETPPVEDGEDRISDSYVQKVRKFPEISNQGDGMKSYAGILFQTIVFPRQMTFIDEPEAFLHPPQMRRLGRTLSDNSPGQLFIATHSSDILRGFLEADSQRVRVIRLRRKGSKHHATELAPEKVTELWRHPQIRYSTALDSIFHEQAINCEDDSDCRLYSAVFHFLENQGEKSKWPDTHFVPAGGKHAMPRIARALSELDVPLKMAFDIDVLNNESTLKSVVESVGGRWGQFEELWTQLNLEVRSGVKPKTNQQIADEIRSLLKDVSQGLPKSEIESALKDDKAWSIVKKKRSCSHTERRCNNALQQIDRNA
ncbi:MAG: ATP-binding protein, partial [Henriciella sp.]|nr:ATP-binding protein [Henriciella sp.]